MARPSAAATRRPVRIGDEFPAIADAHFVARLFGKSVGQIHRMRMQGRLNAFLLKGVPGPARFNGLLLKAWSEGTLEQTHVNGQLARPRSFGIGSRGGLLRSVSSR